MRNTDFLLTFSITDVFLPEIDMVCPAWHLTELGSLAVARPLNLQHLGKPNAPKLTFYLFTFISSSSSHIRSFLVSCSSFNRNSSSTFLIRRLSSSAPAPRPDPGFFSISATVARFCRRRAISRMISAFFISNSWTSLRLFFSSFLSELPPRSRLFSRRP